MQQYVIYTRVSTEDQGRSGLGLEAQVRDIAIFLDKFSDIPFEVLGRFQDIQSGADSERPELSKALDMVRRTGAELLIAKLDRLSRKMSFIATLMDDKKVKLRVAQMPQADKFQLHIYAALAEQERTFISERTKAALKAAKVRHQDARAKDPGYAKRIGGLRDKTMKRNEAIQVKAGNEAAKVMKIIGPLRAAGQTLSAIAETLDSMNIPTSRGGKWTPTQVSRVLERGTIVG
ncbi:recombinase family protein [Rhizobium giardinii]|uniref:DNA invertase Pin-like site-specific DNA recombinase n=1 Tax=Rhizobium giardinii TaxID=56731 RepID=A0A7W8U983_9HYPH|nr:recombinase family protein [Rhizobium giardinii]MBB5535169.1 DNA invertase Pin-like site-specific DNA recombinase [Rhizobium giardinii]